MSDVGLCAERVVAITGAGGGLGRSHALAFARAGATVVVNDIGASLDGAATAVGPAQQVVDEIVAAGGRASADTNDIASWDGAERFIAATVARHGRLDVLVNNAGIVRDRTIAAMSEAEWDAVIAVHLKGTMGPLHHAAVYWRDRAKAGDPVDARVINTTSASGLFGNVGQANYGAAKAGIAALTLVAATELGRYGVTVNAVSPRALTRMTEGIARYDEGGGTAADGFAPLAPENISPLLVWLGSAESSAVTGRVFFAHGGLISVVEGWNAGPSATRETAAWTADELSTVIPDLVGAAAANADMDGRRTGG